MNGNRGGEESVAGLKKGPWTAVEDAVLMEHVKKHGEGNWNAVQRNTGLSRCGKSCRLRWANHLRPNLKKGAFSPEEERLILELHAKLGNKWARMAAQLPGRTDNEIKNYWNTRIKRRQRQGLPLYPPDIQPQAAAQIHLTTMNISPSSMNAVNNHGFPFLDTNGSCPEPSLFSPGHQHHHHHHQPSYMFDGFQAHHFSSHPPPVPLLHQCLQQQQQQLQQPQQFRPAQAVSAVVELPSSQFSQLPCPSYADKAPWSLMPETHVVVSHGGSIEALFNHHENGKLDEFLHLGSVPSETFNHWDGSPAASSIGETNKVVVKEEPDKLQAVQEDLSSLLGMFPAPDPVVPQWYSGSGEATSGQTAGMVADVDIGVDMKQLATSLSATSPTASAAVAAAAEHHQGWTLSSCSWNNMPGIC